MVESVIGETGNRYVYEGEKISIDELWTPYFNVAPRLKHHGFSEENEYRIALAVARGDLLANAKRRKKSINFRLRDNYLVPYVTINESARRQRRLPIVRVIIGPSFEGERRRESLSLLLRENGYDVPMMVSEIPFA